MSEDNNPVDSSQAFGDTELVFEAVTIFAVNTCDDRREQDSNYRRILSGCSLLA